MGTNSNSGTEYLAMDTFECTICFDIPASPIHSCQNGHIVCGICQLKLRQCPTCKSKLAVCPFLQRISKQLDFTSECKFAASSCKQIIKSADMMKHFDACFYRDILCEETNVAACPFNTRIPMKDYQKHLDLVHKCNKVNDLKEELSLTIEKSESNGFWPIEIINENILLQKECLDGQIYFWLSFLGSKEEAAKQRCKIKIEQMDEKCGMVKYSWSLPILAHHEISNRQQERYKHCAIIPTETLYVLGEKEEIPETEVDGIESSTVYFSISIKNNES